jgi:galactose mutarotase-like enzyme
MSTYKLKNDFLTIQMDELGAELTSILANQTKTEYLWNADPMYWKRHSPILFPIVGSLNDNLYTYQGQTYSLPQHGFARDMNFALISHTENEIWFSLDATPETKKVYPFDFRLELGYRLEGKKITVLWKVINKGQSPMYFSIGGHPGFHCPLNQSEEQNNYFISFHTEKPLHYLHVNDLSFAKRKPLEQQKLLATDHGVLPIDAHMFDYDALILEEDQCHQVSLLDAEKKPYVTVSFDAPLFGIWSPSGNNAPFICIEPWYGRCDAADFTGTFEDRQWGNSLDANEVFEANYKIEIGC